MTRSKRIYVLDTNVLMHDPTALFKFEEHDVYLPMQVMEELDNGKKGTSEASRNARQVSRFLNPAGLDPRGDNLYVETAASGTAQTGVAGVEGAGSLRQGALEGSNVSTVQELVDMIETQRAYEVNAKVINAADEMSKYVTQNI